MADLSADLTFTLDEESKTLLRTTAERLESLVAAQGVVDYLLDHMDLVDCKCPGTQYRNGKARLITLHENKCPIAWALECGHSNTRSRAQR